MLSEQRYGNVRRGQHLEVFKHWNTGCTLLLLLEEWKAVSCHFPSCHFQDQHLATSCTSCCCCCVFSPLPSTDRWYKSFDNSPPSSKGGCLCGTSIEWSYAPVTHFTPLSLTSLLAESGGSRGDPVEAFNSMLSHVLWRCLTETSPLPGQPFCFWGFTPKKGRGEESQLCYLCLHKNQGFLIVLSVYSEPRIGVLTSLFPSLDFS